MTGAPMLIFLSGLRQTPRSCCGATARRLFRMTFPPLSPAMQVTGGPMNNTHACALARVFCENAIK
ncbi:MAG: hypothetical protein ACI4ML_04515 [Aristaeellaceae bacterium]